MHVRGSRSGQAVIGLRRIRVAESKALRLVVVLCLTLAGLVVAGVASASPASAAGTPVSQSKGQFLSGTVAGTDLSSIASLAPATSSSPGNEGPTTAPISATVLNSIPVNLNGVSIFGNSNLIQLGAVNQYSAASADGSSKAASGAVTNAGSINVNGGTGQGSATIDASPLLSSVPAVSSAIDKLKVSLDGVASTATQAAGANGTQTGTYAIAGGTLTMHSPIVAGIPTTVNTALTAVQSSVNSLAGSNGLLANVLKNLSAVQSLGLTLNTTATVSIDTSPVTTLLNTPLTSSDGSVSVNLQTGTITVDLTKLGAGLNGRAANTEVLNATALSSISSAVSSLVSNLVTNLDTALTNVLKNATIHIAANAGVLTGPTATGLSITVDGSVSQILAGTGTTSITLKLLGAPVTLTANTLLSSLGTVLQSTLLGAGGASDTFASTLNSQVVTPVTGTLATGLGIVNQVLSLVVNGQSTSAGAFTETALNVGLLTSNRIPLANSTVGPNAGPSTPTIASSGGLNPTSGPVAGGQTVTVTGTGYVPGSTSVSIGGNTVAAANVTVNGAGTSLTFATPAHSAGAVTVSVTTPYGTSSTSAYTYVAATPAPTVSGLNPTSGTTAGGDTVTVTGANFVAGSTSVTIGGTTVSAANVTVNSSSSLTFATPAHAAGAVDVTVTTPNGTSAPQTFTYIAPSVPQPPATTGISPTSGPTAGGQTVTVTGSNFVAGATSVTIGGTTVNAANVTVNSSSSLTFTTPAHAAGTVDVTVTTANGTSGAQAYTYVAPVPTSPTETGISPSSGPVAGGQTVTVTGTNFVVGSTSVSIGGTTVSAANVTVDSATSLHFTTPAHAAGSVNVTVTTPNGTSGAQSYTYVVVAVPPVPLIINPDHGTTLGGDTVTLTGTGFVSGGTTVTIGGVLIPASDVTVGSPLSLTFVTPAHAAGAVNVTVTTSGGTSGALTYTYVAPPLAVPTAGSLSPDNGPSGGGQSVTITGTGFIPGATTVTVDGHDVPASDVTVDSTTSLHYTTPAHSAGGTTVTVSTAGGTSGGLTYTYNHTPTVSGLSPNRGPAAGGQTVTVTGTDFATGATAVTIGGTTVAASDVTVASATSLSFTTPAHAAGAVDVTVTTLNGTSNPATYTYYDAPGIASSGIDPARGPAAGGQTVTVTGTKFVAGATSVSIGGTTVAASDVSVASPTSLSFTTPAHAAGAVTVTVTTPGGTSGTSGYTYYAAPTVASSGGLSPNRGPAAGGQTVLVTGSNFANGLTTVVVDGTAVSASDVTVNSATSLTYSTPAHAAGTVSVSVQTPGGSDSANYTYYDAPVLDATNALSPDQGPTSGGQTVTVTGNSFVAGATSVTLDGTVVSAANVTVLNASQLTFTTPAHVAGPVQVTVTAPGGTSGPATYTFDDGATLSALSPNRGPVAGGTTVTVTGNGFVPGFTTVAVDGTGVPISDVTVNSTTSLTFTTPPHAAGSVPVTVTTPGGTSGARQFTYLDAPTIASSHGLSPNRGPVAGGQSVTVTGTSFVTGATTVVVDGTAVPDGDVTVNSATSLTYSTPAHSAGSVTVSLQTPGGNGGSANYTYYDAPTLDATNALSPARGPVAGGQTVTVIGSNFVAGATSVTVDQAIVSATVVSPTQLTFVTPAHAAGPVSVTVSTPGGTTGPTTYTFLDVASIDANGLNPDAGPLSGGQTVTVTGHGFVAGATSVTVDGVTIPASQVTVLSATSLTYSTPAHSAGDVDITVTTPGGTSSPGTYSYLSGPSIASNGLTPNSGPTAGGQTVSVSGSGFVAGATSITVDGTVVPANAVTVTSSTQLTYSTPAHAAGAVTVTVTTPGGTSNSASYTYLVAPSIASNGLTPNSGPTAGGQTVTVTGSGFVAGATSVTVDQAIVAATVLSATQLTFVTPAHAAGPVTVTVATPGGTSGTGTYTFLDAPSISSNGLTPNSGPTAGGQTVTVTGSGFVAGATSVTVDGALVPANAVTVTSSTQLTYSTPAHSAGAVTVTVTTPGGTSNSASYTYLVAPSISSNGLTPNSGPTTGGQTVTVTGSGFVAGATSVTVDGTAVPANAVTVNSATSLTYSTPAHAAGAVTVTVTTPGGTSGSATYTYFARPTMTGMNPQVGPQTGGQTVTVTGTGFAAGQTSVVVDGTVLTPGEVTVGSPTQLTFVTPAHVSGGATVVVMTPGGTTAESFAYLYLPSFTPAPVPTVSSLTPSNGPAAGGQTVTVTGANFVPGSTTVTIDGITVPASAVTVVNQTTLTFVTPQHTAGNVGVTVTTGGGTSGQLGYTFVAAPSIASSHGLNPNSGPTTGGQLVTVTGSNFVTGATSVTVDGTVVPANAVTVYSATSLVYSTPAHPVGPVDVTVTTPGGTSTAATYTYLAAPSIASGNGLSPNEGPVSGGQTVTVTGSGFVSGATSVTVDQTIVSATVLNANQLTFVTPAHAAGPVGVTVSSPGGTSAPVTYTYDDAPAIASSNGLNPARGPVAGGQTVTVTGTGFVSGATTVTVDGTGVPIADVTVNSATSLTVVTPPHAAGPVDVTVTTPGGTSGARQYTYVDAPVVANSSDLSPDFGPTAGGQQVTVTGSNFVPGATTVTVDGTDVPASDVTVDSTTSLTYTTPAHALGTVPVTVTTEGGTSSPVSYTYYVRPRMTDMNPGRGPETGGTTVTVTGSGFVAGATSVSVDSTVLGPNEVTVLSSTSLTFVTPAHVSGGAGVDVTTPGGTTADSFEYLYTPTSVPAPAPTVSGIDPAVGPSTGGQTVTVSGANFVPGSTTVTIGGNTVATSDVTVINQTTLTFRTPAHPAGGVDLAVTTNGGTSGAQNYTYVAAPTEAGLNPTSGPDAGGQTVTVTGTAFVPGATTVTIGGVTLPAAQVTVTSPTTLTFTTPDHSAGLVGVIVTTAGGSSAPLSYTYVAPVVPTPAPTATGLNPVSGNATGGQTVTVTGTGFVPGTTWVTIGGTAISASQVTVTSPTTLTFTTPAHAAGPVDVTVTTANGTSGPLTYTYVTALPATPTTSALSPSHGPVTGGQTVTVTGTNFVPGSTSVTIGGVLVSASDVVVTSPTTLTFVTPVHATGDVDVTVTTNGGTTSPALPYGYLPQAQPAPGVTGLTPGSGPDSGSTVVTVTGSNFVAGQTTVTIGGNTVDAAHVSVLSATSLRFATPAHVSGPVSVTVTTPGGTTSPVSFTYTSTVVTPAAPTLTTVSPAVGDIAGGETVTLTGTGFVAGQTTVRIGGITVPAADVTVTSPTSLTFTAPSHTPGDVTIYVTTPAGNTTTEPYQYTAPIVTVAVPTASGLSPVSGPDTGNTVVTVTGTGFVAGATTVTIGGVTIPAAQVTVTSATSLTFSTPAHVAGGVTVTVTTAGGTSAGQAYTYTSTGVTPTATGPTNAGMTPRRGPIAGGDTVTVTGTGFVAGATTVTVDGVTVPAAQVTVTSATSLTFLTPAHAAGPVKVVITTAAGSTVGRTYTYMPAATVASFTPNMGPVSGGQTITVTGTGFVAGATSVIINSDGSDVRPAIQLGSARLKAMAATPKTGVRQEIPAASVNVLSATKLTFVTPPDLEGSTTVAITTPAGTSTVHLYTYVGMPQGNSLSPKVGPDTGGTLVTVQGSGFIAGQTIVQIGSKTIPASKITVLSATQLTFRTPAQPASWVKVLVTTPGGTDYTDSYQYTATPGTPVAGGPTITTPGNGVGLTSRTPVISGTGKAGARVNVYDGTTKVCSTVVSTGGTWSCVPTTALGNGWHSLQARQDSADATGYTVSNTVRVFAGPGTIAVTSPGDKANIVTTRPRIAGTGTPNTLVTVTEKGRTICTATVSAAGTWSCVPTVALSTGSHAFSVTSVTRSGEKLPTQSLNFSVRKDATSSTPSSVSPVSQVGTVTPLHTNSSSGPLSYTGAAVSSPFMIGLSLLAGGLLLLFLAAGRRRRDEEEELLDVEGPASTI